MMETTMFVRNVSHSSGRGLLLAACAAAFFAASPVGAALARGHGHSHSSSPTSANADPSPGAGAGANGGGSPSSTDPHCWNGAVVCGATGD